MANSVGFIYINLEIRKCKNENVISKNNTLILDSM